MSALSLSLTYLIYFLFEFVYLRFSLTYYKINIVDVQSGKQPIIRFFPFAIVCYIILAFSLWFFVLKNSKTYHETFINATILAILVYGVYNLTNLTTFYKYKTIIAIVDILWGIIIFNIVGFVYLFMKKYKVA